MTINNRKLEHIQIVQERDVYPYTNPFEKYQLPYKALPEIDFDKIDPSVDFFGKKLSFPFCISSMTGGPEKGKIINENLARAAERAGVALGLGSMRVILRKPESLESFGVRELCPSIPLFANIGIVQLNYGYGADEINRIIDSIDADGIFLHVNPLQEVVQPEGDLNFENLIAKLATIIPKLNTPIIIKEVGNGIDQITARKLYDIGVTRIDVSGLGGTSWPAVEGYRRQDRLAREVKKLGIPTDEAIKQCSKIDGLQLIAGGGLRSGVDVAKALALGAHIATAAQPFLDPALESEEAVYDELMLRKKEFQIALFSMGLKSVDGLYNQGFINYTSL